MRFFDLHRASEFAARFAFVQTPQRPHRLAPRIEPGRKRVCRCQILEPLAREARAACEIDDVFELAPAFECGLEFLALRFTHPAHEMKSESQRPRMIDETPPFGVVDRNRLHDHAVAFCIVDQHFGCIEAHRLYVEDRGAKDRRLVTLHVGRGVGEQREACGVRFGEAVVGEAFEHVEERIGARAVDAVFHHTVDEFGIDFGHARPRALVAHRAAQLIGLPRREARRFDRHAHALFLEERHAERAFENRLEFGMRIRDGLEAVATA